MFSLFKAALRQQWDERRKEAMRAVRDKELVQMTRPALVVLDSGIPAPDVLAAGLDEHAQFLRLSPDANPLETVAGALERNPGCWGALHLVAHGSEGTLFLGGLSLSADTLEVHRALICRIGAALAEEAVITLTACYVG